MIGAYSSWKWHKILERFLRSIKISICKTEKFKLFKSMLIYALNTLAQIPASVKCGMRSARGTAEALLSLQLVWIVGSTVSHICICSTCTLN